VQELIYLYCENDFNEDESMGKPEAVMSWLRQFVRSQAITRTSIVYAPYVFNVVPEVTRVPGERGERFKHHADEKARLLALVQDAGFAWIDSAHSLWRKPTPVRRPSEPSRCMSMWCIIPRWGSRSWRMPWSRPPHSGDASARAHRPANCAAAQVMRSVDRCTRIAAPAHPLGDQPD
jgi:hypothetical protein